MMKDAIIRIVLLVVILGAVVWINVGWVSKEFGSLDGIKATVRGSGTTAGMNRFLAHVNWMRLLQFRAIRTSQKRPEPAVVEALYRRFDTVTDQDPFFAKAYEHGALDLATMGKPELAIKLLDKGIGILGDDNWKLPHYAAHISRRYLYEDDQAKKDVQVEKYLLLARNSKNHPFFIESALVRIEGKKNRNDPLALAKLWKKIGRFEGVGHEGMSGDMEFGGNMDEYRFGENSRKQVVTLLRSVRSQVAKATGEDKSELARKARKIETILRSMMPSANACPYCFAEYKPGDKFCNNCGRAVKVYGVCPKCGTVAHGKYCTKCGTKIGKKK